MTDKTNNQPLSNVRWITPDVLTPNAYNPNHVAPPELELLKTSIKENGWTQPIVANRHDEIVDGFHRWTVSQHDDIAELTGGLIPVVYLNDSTDEATQKMATIRHNRARGTHHVLKMADIITALIDAGLDEKEISKRLQMENEEVRRLAEHGHKPTRGSNPEGFNNGWAPTRKKQEPKQD